MLCILMFTPHQIHFKSIFFSIQFPTLEQRKIALPIHLLFIFSTSALHRKATKKREKNNNDRSRGRSFQRKLQPRALDAGRYCRWFAEKGPVQARYRLVICELGNLDGSIGPCSFIHPPARPLYVLRRAFRCFRDAGAIAVITELKVARL